MVNFFSGFVDPEAAEIMSNMFDVSRELRKKFEDDEYSAAMTRWRTVIRIPGRFMMLSTILTIGESRGCRTCWDRLGL